MSKPSAEIRSLARSHTETAINTLAGIMRQKKAPASARVAAASALLDRGWGKPIQGMEMSGPEGGPIPTIQFTDKERARALASFVAKTTAK